MGATWGDHLHRGEIGTVLDEKGDTQKKRKLQNNFDELEA